MKKTYSVEEAFNEMRIDRWLRSKFGNIPQVLVINGILLEREYKRTHFPCTYIKGMCTVKPTWKVCSGGEPDDYCEMRINNRL